MLEMDTRHFFLNRATRRQYTDRDISDQLLNDLLFQASHAPTTGNMQLYSVIVTRDPERKRQLAPAHFNQPSVTAAPVVLTFCADFNRFVKWCRQRGADPGYDNFQSFMTAVLDTVILAQQFCTVAEMAGLGCCYLGTTTYNAPQIAELLDLPPMVVPVTTLTVGYPAGDGVEVGRLPLDGWVHSEKYADYTPAAIDSIYAEKESRDDSRRFVEENGKDSLAQVFTDVRYTRQANELFSAIFRDFIARSGFPFPE